MLGKVSLFAKIIFSPIFKDARGRLFKNALPKVNLPRIIMFVLIKYYLLLLGFFIEKQ
jgi:hypothetical protein